MRRRVMSMLVGAALAASTLLGGAGSATAAAPPPEFGNDWHDPVTAAPPVSKPQTTSCEVKLAEAQFRDFTPYKGDYAPPRACGKSGRWGKVVLRMDGKVKGRQYDRLGYLRVGGVEVFRTSTPEPSVDGIAWSVEKDVTRYRETFSRDRQVEMLIGNVVDETYTGIIDVQVTLTFYAPERRNEPRQPRDAALSATAAPFAQTASSTQAAPSTQAGTSAPAAAPDRVIPLGDSTSLSTPRNSERIVAEVYATGSGGGCEEYWYLTVPDAAPYSCKADQGPYREVQVTVDGRLAGIAAPFPTVWTGGWSNPFLWYVIPGPRAFDIKPVEYDLTPFAGLLNDGRPHKVEVSVVGVPEAQTGWNTPVNVLVWQDEQKERVTGGLIRHAEGDLVNEPSYTPGSGDAPHSLQTRGGHRLSISGYVNTSHGRVATTVTRTLANTSAHRWTEGEAMDALKATWTDREMVTTGHRAVRHHRTYTMDGTTTLGAGDRLRTEISLGDREEGGTTQYGKGGERRVNRSVTDDRYDGDATYTANVPRDQRHAVGTSRERYRMIGDSGCYDRTLATVQGTLTEDRLRC
ncbi:peptide-N4-asparagine amidase [Streptomyces sp. NPDC047123]|uniref:peptide-N4-asparagine amidase n=1 Tax=Streptomyces sp. NPDC047123 TaxID=3155622 RepID=UPI0033F30532